MITIRKTQEGDLDKVAEILDEARGTIAKLGINQWQDGYPNRAVIEEDLLAGRSYVAEAEGAVCGTFALITDGEETYNQIYDGAWLTGESDSYIAIHRVAIAVSSRGTGVSTAILNYACSEAEKMGRASIRIDTHEGNKVMRRMLEKHNLTYCGIIYLESGDERVAYEKILRK